MKTNIFNIMILDESGSMSGIKKQAIDGYNETLQTIKAAQVKHIETQQHFITLVTFDSEATKTIYDRVPCDSAKELTNETYQPGCSTPLYDAMGTTLSKFRNTLDETQENRILVTIITDGEENASKEYTGIMIKKLVEELKALGWVFTYIGANQDIEKVAASISITNVWGFQATHEGTQAMFMKAKSSRSRFFDRLQEGVDSQTLNSDFFEDEKQS